MIDCTARKDGEAKLSVIPSRSYHNHTSILLGYPQVDNNRALYHQEHQLNQSTFRQLLPLSLARSAFNNGKTNIYGAAFLCHC